MSKSYVTHRKILSYVITQWLRRLPAPFLFNVLINLNMKQLVQITYTVELERDTDAGDALDKDILAEVGLDELNEYRDDESFEEDFVTVTYLWFPYKPLSYLTMTKETPMSLHSWLIENHGWDIVEAFFSYYEGTEELNNMVADYEDYVEKTNKELQAA